MSTPPPGPAHLASVDVLRALACLWVVLFHTGMFWLGGYWYGFPAAFGNDPSITSQALLWTSRLGFHGVSLFLVLSGFCLYYPLARRHGVAGASVDLRVFARRRLTRILPAYYASIVLLVALASNAATASVVMRPITTGDVVAHALLVHNLHPATIWTMNGAYWSLGLEAQLYVVFPLLVALARRRGVFASAGLCLALCLLWYPVLAWARRQGFSVDGYGVFHEALPARVFEFSAGMVAAAFLAEDRPAPRWLLAMLSLLWIPASHLVQLSGLVDFPFDRPFNGVAFAALLVLAGRLPSSLWRSPPARFLAWIGGFSYSLYLAHQPLLLASLRPVWGLGLPAWQRLLLATIVSIAAGFAFFLLFERPAQRWAQKKTLPMPEGLHR